MSHTKVTPDFFERLSAEMKACRERVNTYTDDKREVLDQLARSLMGQAVSVDVGRARR
jgi:hypothetical protein